MSHLGLDQTLVPLGAVEELFYWDDKVELGSGTFAVVYKAKRRADGEFFAVKCTAKARMETNAQWQQLAHEVIICKHLNNPGCVKCHDAFQDKQTVYLVLEWVPGGDLLNAILKRKAEFTEFVVASFARQILETLVYLHHEKGITHRDLKPENILLTSSDLHRAQLKFTDFGFAKFFGHMEDPARSLGRPLGLSPISPDFQCIFQTNAPLLPDGGSHTISPAAPGTLLNTPKGSVRYLAPEIIGHLSEHGCKPRVTTRPEIQKVDMYAVGVVVYVQLCAKFPYKGNNVDVIKHSMETHRLCFPVSCTAQPVSSLAKQFCRWLMEKDPARRPLALQALRHSFLHPPPSVVAPAVSQGTSEAAELDVDVPHDVEEVRKQESDIDKQGFEPPQEVIAHLQPRDVPGAAAEDSRVIPVRTAISGLQLNFPKLLRRRTPDADK